MSGFALKKKTTWYLLPWVWIAVFIGVIGLLIAGISLVKAADGSYGLWSDSDTPSLVTDPDEASVELGVRFKSSEDGVVAGVKFYKGPKNTGIHTGSLWDSAGNRLANVTFKNETAEGWQRARFENPVMIQANAIYTVSYHAPNGSYSSGENYFTWDGRTNGALTAEKTSDEAGNGVYAYGDESVFPTSTYHGANYWVDVIFTPKSAMKPAVPANVSAHQQRDAIVVKWDNSTDGDLAAEGYRIYRDGLQIAEVAATAREYTDTTNLANATEYIYTIRATAQGAESDLSQPASVVYATPISVWPDETVTEVTHHEDANAVELGVKFRTTTSGKVTGVKFFKGDKNVGPHTGSLWDTAGNRLATVTFADETVRGWQRAYFAEPIAIDSNKTYVISYHTNGFYAAESGYFHDKNAANGSLTALQNHTDGTNGVYMYGDSAYPANSYNAANYWVDVIFTPAVSLAIPTVPQNVKAAQDLEKITVSWDASTSKVSTVSRYLVYRNGIQIASVDAPAMHYVDTVLEDKKTYGYQVKAVDVKGEMSDLSNSVGIVYKAPQPQQELDKLTRKLWEGGPAYYDKFPQAKAMGWTNPNFYPIALWGAAVDEQWQIDSYKEVGINTFLELYTATPNLALLRENGMSVIHGATNRPDMGDETVGWMLSDEPEQHEQEDPRKVIDYLNEQKKRFPADDGRMHFTNFTANMLWPTFPPGPEYTTKWLDANDVNSLDIYWHARDLVCGGNIAGEIWKDGSGAPQPHGNGYNTLSEAECHRASNYGWQIDAQRRLSMASGKAEPVFGFVENGSPADTNPINGPVHTITPDEMTGAMWNMIIHGASGINIFNHTLNGACITSDNLNHPCYAAMRQKTKEVSAQIRQLASVINTQSFNYEFDPLLDTALKEKDGSYYILAMPAGIKGGSATGQHTLRLPIGLEATHAEVLFENRNVPVVNGAITDNFEAQYTYHIYKITP
jgi:hypothetical protein